MRQTQHSYKPTRSAASGQGEWLQTQVVGETGSQKRSRLPMTPGRKPYRARVALCKRSHAHRTAALSTHCSGPPSYGGACSAANPRPSGGWGGRYRRPARIHGALPAAAADPLPGSVVCNRCIPYPLRFLHPCLPLPAHPRRPSQAPQSSHASSTHHHRRCDRHRHRRRRRTAVGPRCPGRGYAGHQGAREAAGGPVRQRGGWSHQLHRRAPGATALIAGQPPIVARPMR